MTSTKLARSYLFVPGNRPERFEKGRASGADALILDLEDAVPAEEKENARSSVSKAVAEQHRSFVRVNAAGTPWFEGDLSALANRRGLLGVVLAKAETPAQVSSVISRLGPGVVVLPIIESACGFAALRSICQTPGVTRVIFGTLDFQLDLGMEGDEDALSTFRSQIVLESRLAKIHSPVDGISTVIDASEIVQADAKRGRRFGFGAKLCIHPRQIEPVHAAYAWSGEEISWAERVLIAVDKSDGNAVAVDGKMVDLPVILKAKRILER